MAEALKLQSQYTISDLRNAGDIMRKYGIRTLFFLVSLSFLLADNVASEARSETLPLQAGVFEHIQFAKITANKYVFNDDELTIEVDNSASFLMMPFDKVRTIEKVTFKWRSQGELKTRNAHHEKHRDGDDAYLKLGLLLKTDAAWPNPFAPKWLKRVEKLLKYPSERMINLVAGAKHKPGEHWVGPYNKRIKMISVYSVADDSGWQLASYQFDEPVEVVALWVMADGDNTNSNFMTKVKDIKLD